jgi:hypothetical protein
VDYINLAEGRNQLRALVNIYGNESFDATECREFSTFLTNYWLLSKVKLMKTILIFSVEHVDK